MGSTKIQQAPLPPAPDYGKISRENLLAQIELAPKLFAAEASPTYGQAAYANLQNQVNEILASGQMQQLAKYYPEIANIEADYLNRTRANEIAQLQSPEVGLAATQRAFNQLTPGYAEAAQNMGEFAAQQTAAAAQQPGYTAYEQQVAGPTAGQFLGQIGGPSADLTLGGMQAYRPGQALGGLGEYQVGRGFLSQPEFQAGQFVGQVEGPSADLSLGGLQTYRPGQELAGLAEYQVGQGLLSQPAYQAGRILGGLGEYQVGQGFLSQPTFQAGQFAGQVGGPQLQSGLGNINQGLVQSYINQMPGVQDLAEQLTEQASEELAAGRELTPEEVRQATQAAREAYAARGTALGPQAITAEILARSELGDQRLRERQAAAAQAAQLSSQLYTPALQQVFQRQMGAEQYGLGAQQQVFGQAMSQEDLARAAQAQAFQQQASKEQALAGAQTQAFGQRMSSEDLARAAQSQAFQQQSAIEQALAGAQAQAFGQRMGGEELARAAQAQQAQQQLAIQQLGLSAQGQEYQQALNREQLGASAQAQAFQQEAAKEQALAGAQAQAFTQRMGSEELGRAAQGQEFQQRAGLQELGLGVQSQAYQQALGRENLAAQTQNQAFQQALQRTQQGLAAQQALQGLQAGRAQMGAAAMGALQQVQAPILQAFYRQPILSGMVPQQQQFALAGQQLAGPALFNPESQMGFQAAYTPYQAQVAQNIGAMQASATASAGKSAMIGSIGGGLLGAGGMIGGAMIL